MAPPAQVAQVPQVLSAPPPSAVPPEQQVFGSVPQQQPMGSAPGGSPMGMSGASMALPMQQFALPTSASVADAFMTEEERRKKKKRDQLSALQRALMGM